MPIPMLQGPGFSQRTGRVWRAFTDQHGRVFKAHADAATNQPIGEFVTEGWSAPWLPPMRYATWERDGDLTFRWDYASCAEDMAQTAAAYYDEAIKVAIQEHLEVPEVGGPVERRVRAVVGAPPLSAALPVSAEAGDPWVLGVANAPVNHELKAVLEQSAGASTTDFLKAVRAKVAGTSATSEAMTADVTESLETEDAGVSYRDFLGEARKRGMSMADAALAWQAHKANLAAA